MRNPNYNGEYKMVKDSRRNAMVEQQRWQQLVYIDVESFDQYIDSMTKTVDWSIYYFSGMSERGTIRVDSNPDTNANTVMDAFDHVATIRKESVPLIAEDAPFILYNPNGAVIKSAVQKGLVPESTLHSKYMVKTPKGNLGFKINQWQKDMFDLVIPGGFFISKRPTTSHTQVLTTNPKMFYVHDSRSFAHIVRIDQKPFDYEEPKEFSKWVEEQDQHLIEKLDGEEP